MSKIKYYQLAFKDSEVKKLTSPGRMELETLTADGWTLQGYDNAADIPANPILDNGTVREMTAAEIEASETTAKLTRNVFTQLEIREAFKALDKEADLDALLNGNAEFKTYWTEAQEIDLNHEVTQQAIAGFTEEEINTLKMEI